MDDRQSESAEQPCAVVWLGPDDPLLRAIASHADVLHVMTARAALHALERGVASCLVVDAALLEADIGALLREVRHRWPHMGLLVTGERLDGMALGAMPFPEVDRYVPRDTPPQELLTVLTYLAERAAYHTTGGDYLTLQRRARHLEGLLQASFAISGTLNVRAIVGDLREIGRTAVDADDVAVLIASEDYSDLFDGLQLGVPTTYLELCRATLAALTPEERMAYLSDEVLLRERMPDMLPTAIRVREAAAAEAWSYMRVPMTVDQNLIGFVAFFADRPGRFNGAHLQLGRLFTAQVAAAVRNMQLYLRLHSAEQRQRAVSQVASLIADNLAIDTVLARIVEEAVRLVDGLAGMVQLVQPNRSLVVSAVYNLPDSLVGQTVGFGGEHSGRIASTGRPQILTGPYEWDGAGALLHDLLPPDAVWFGVPLLYRGMVLGVLQVIRERRGLVDVQDIQDVLMMLAPQAATAIAKAQLHAIVRQEQRHLQAVLNHTPALVLVCDAEGRAQLANREAKRVLERWGLSFESIKGEYVLDIVQSLLPDGAPPLDSLIDVLDRTVEVSLGRAGVYLLQIASIKTPDGAREGYVAVAQDVTELRRVDRMKANLTRVLTHDLGNLLMLAHNPIQLLDEPDITPEQRQMLKRMLITSLERMEALVRDVTDLEMASSLGHDTMAPYKLSALAERAVARSDEEARRRHISLTLVQTHSPMPALMGHAVLIMEAIDNLISNAIKYTPDGGQVVVSTSVEGDYAVVRVGDTGYGIPADKLDAIFEPFVRVKDPRTAHIHGTGLGLSLVKTFAEAHGGTVSVQSTPDVGSEFALYLPMRALEERPSQPKQFVQLDLSALVAHRLPLAGR